MLYIIGTTIDVSVMHSIYAKLSSHLFAIRGRVWQKNVQGIVFTIAGLKTVPIT